MDNDIYRDKHKAEQKMIGMDSQGKETGEIINRWEAHSGKGIKHLAFAVFVLNNKNEFILHKRPARKVGKGKWDTPVSHVLEGETREEAIARCLKEEYGIEKIGECEHFPGFSYEELYEDGTCENEYCVVSVCKYDGEIKPNPLEVDELKKLPANTAFDEWKNNSQNYEIWFNKSIELLSKNEKGKKYLE